MSTRNNKGNKPRIEQPEENAFIPQELKEKYNTPEAKEEIINKLVEEQAAVVDEKEEIFLNSTVEEIEAQPVNETEEPCVCDEPCAEPCVCTDPSCACIDETSKPLEFHHEFQDEYHFGPGNGDAVIDTLPEPEKAPELQVKRPKTFAEMTACEINIYHKTGILPLI